MRFSVESPLYRLCCTVLSIGFLFLFAVIAEADSDIDITVAYSPDTFQAGDTITIQFSFNNTTEYDCTELYISNADGSGQEHIEDIAAGEIARFTRKHPVSTEEMEDAYLVFSLRYILNGETYEKNIPFTLRSEMQEASVEFTRRISAPVANQTGKATIVYEVYNGGTSDLRSVSISDTADHYREQIDSLFVGERHTFVHTLDVVADTVSSPILIYSTEANPDVYHSITLEDAAIAPMHGNLEYVLIAGHSLHSADTAEVVLRLKNASNQEYRSLTVSDDILGGVIADSITLPSESEPIEITHSYPIRGDATYRWRITGTTLSGDVIDIVTETVEMPISAKSGKPSLSLRANTAFEEISKAGVIPVSFELNNTGSASAVKVVVSEETDGEICKFTIIPTGTPTTRTVDVQIDDDRTLQFLVDYESIEGETQSAYADPINVSIARGGLEPEGTQRERFFFVGTSTGVANPQIMTIFIAIAVSVVVILSFILIVSSRRARFNRKVEAAARKQLTNGDTGKLPRTSSSGRNAQRKARRMRNRTERR